MQKRSHQRKTLASLLRQIPYSVYWSSPKQDPRPPFKPFYALSSLPRCQAQHVSPKFLPSHVPHHFLTTPAPHNPGLLQHSNLDPSTGALNSSVLLFHTTAASLRKGPSPTTVHFPFPTPYLSCNHLSA